MAGAAALGAAGVVGAGVARPTAGQAKLIETAATTEAAGASLSDIEHVVILMQENRSFDHYFGTLSGVRGLLRPDVLTQTSAARRTRSSTSSATSPASASTSSGYLQPFHLLSDPPPENGQTTNDIDHSWGRQHPAGTTARWTRSSPAHLAADGATNGPVTMGYFTRADLPFYYALADAFTICDGYHCSVLGPDRPEPADVDVGVRSTRRAPAAARCSDLPRPTVRDYGTLHLGDDARARCSRPA